MGVYKPVKNISGNAATATLAAAASTDSQHLGISQTYADKKAERAFGTTYYNTTGKPMYVSVCNAVYTNYSTIYVDGVEVAVDYGAGGATYIFVSAIVPPGSSYMVTSPGNQFIISWAELG